MPSFSCFNFLTSPSHTRHILCTAETVRPALTMDVGVRFDPRVLKMPLRVRLRCSRWRSYGVFPPRLPVV